MAQGFKTKAPGKGAHKAASSTTKKQQPKDLKKGARTIPPKKQAAVARAVVHKKHTSSHASELEKVIATQAVSHGKLTIMRSIADESEDGRRSLAKKK